DTQHTAGFGLLFSASIIATPVTIKANSLLCVTEESGLAELHFSSAGQSFTFMRHMHRKALLTVDVRICHRTRDVKLFVYAAERLEKY
ncbi:hypothetical protein, partial [Enterobacter roggenkampii]|uniref:hypothetical protein n=1 Tax=Enterobacter roggenkampii TaxID=1812935 RepID=UPI002A82F319